MRNLPMVHGSYGQAFAETTYEEPSPHAERHEGRITDSLAFRHPKRRKADASSTRGRSRESRRIAYAFLRAINHTEDDLNAFAERAPLHEIVEICERALAFSKDPALGLHWADGLSEQAFRPVSHLISHTGSLRNGLALMERFEPLFCDQRIYWVAEGESTMSIRMAKWNFGSLSMERFAAELLLGAMMKIARVFSSRAQPLAARFGFAAPAHHAEYERVFGAVVRFDQSQTELVFDRALLDLPSLQGDQEIYAALNTVAEQRLARLTNSAPLSMRLRVYLCSQVPQRSNTESAARILGLSTRSLRRQLAMEGTSYREVEHAVLRDVAMRLLCDQGLTIQEAAHELKFADAATFHRAFKRWTGMTPSECRESRVRAATKVADKGRELVRRERSS